MSGLSFKNDVEDYQYHSFYDDLGDQQVKYKFTKQSLKIINKQLDFEKK